MDTIKISELQLVNEITDSDVIPLSQNGITKNTNIKKLKELIGDGIAGQTPDNPIELGTAFNFNNILTPGFYKGHIGPSGTQNAPPTAYVDFAMTVRPTGGDNIIQDVVTSDGGRFSRSIEVENNIFGGWVGVVLNTKQYERIDLTNLEVAHQVDGSGRVDYVPIIAGYLDFTIIGSDTLVTQLYFQLETPVIFTPPGGNYTTLDIELNFQNYEMERAIYLMENASVSPYPGVHYWVPTANIEYINSSLGYGAMPGFVKRVISRDNPKPFLHLNFDCFPHSGINTADIVASYDVIINGGI